MDTSHEHPKFPPYSLPKLYGWHMISKQSKGAQKDFGLNWWDLLYSDSLPLLRGSITINSKNVHSIIFINMGGTVVEMTNSVTGDLYKVFPGQRSTVNNTFDKLVTLTSSNKDTTINLTKIGSIILLLLRVDELKSTSNDSSFNKTVLFTDFLLMSGVPDKDQYLNTVGLESMDLHRTKGWKFIETDSDRKISFVDSLLEQWAKVNPKSRKTLEPKSRIPKSVHWIWLRRDVKGQEFGPLKQKFYRFMDTWINRNPTFSFNLWTDNPDFVVPNKYVDVIRVRGPSDIKVLMNKFEGTIKTKIKYLYNNHANVGARSDTLRQAILYFEGGFYADVNDAVCLASLDKIAEKFDYIIGVEPVIYVNNAIIASKKRHMFTQAMLVWLAHNAHTFVDEWNDEYANAEQEDRDDYVVSTTGPIALSSVIWGTLRRKTFSDSLILPASWVYPNYWIPSAPNTWLKPVSMFAHYDQREYLKTN